MNRGLAFLSLLKGCGRGAGRIRGKGPAVGPPAARIGARAGRRKEAPQGGATVGPSKKLSCPIMAAITKRAAATCAAVVVNPSNASLATEARIKVISRTGRPHQTRTAGHVRVPSFKATR